MTIIHIMSDLHLEFAPQTLPGGDVLILAGDICEYRTLSKQFHSTKAYPYIPGSLNAYDFFFHECAKYKKVFMVMGNHEHYHHRFDKTWLDLVAILPDNITLLEDQCEEYDGVLYLGATLWTDLNKDDSLTKFHLKGMMNDYRVIQYHDPVKDLYHKLIPEATAKVHHRTVQYFKTILEQNRDKKVVVITHHAPSFASVHEYYKHDTVMNGGYASDLSEFILDNDNIKYFFHGHMHNAVDYMIGTTRVMSNPRGYIGHEDTSNFDVNFTIEV